MLTVHCAEGWRGTVSSAPGMGPWLVDALDWWGISHSAEQHLNLQSLNPCDPFFPVSASISNVAQTILAWPSWNMCWLVCYYLWDVGKQQNCSLSQFIHIFDKYPLPMSPTHFPVPGAGDMVGKDTAHLNRGYSLAKPFFILLCHLFTHLTSICESPGIQVCCMGMGLAYCLTLGTRQE